MIGTEKPRVSLWTILLLSASAGVVDLGYAVEGAYAIPVILAAGIPLRYASLTLSLSPALGLILQPFIGAATDLCRCFWGKRKPFILLFGLTAVICSGTIPYYFYINVPHKSFIIPFCVVACVMLFDLSTGTLLIPTKALMLDLVPKSQEDMTNLLSSAGVGLLTCLGFGFGAIDWSTVTGNEKSIEKQSEIVFGCTAGIYMIIVLTVVMCIREILPGFLRINQNNSTVYGSIPSQNSAPFTDSANDKIGVTCCMNPFKLLRNSLLETIKFFYHMSRRMWIVFLTFTMAYAAEFSFVYSYTVFVGTVAYKGDPKADVNSHSYLRYSEGVRMGSLGLAIGSFVNIFSSLLLTKLMNYISLKTLFLCFGAVFTCSTCLLMYFHQLPAILVFGAVYGPFLGVSIAVPYGLVSIYKVKEIKNKFISLK